MKICVLNGPNLNYLGKREPAIYGSRDFLTYLDDLRDLYKEEHSLFYDIKIDYYQSNIEGELINKLYEINEDKSYVGVVFNAGAYTHTSIALHDCIKAIDVPVIEVHISNVAAREDYRKVSYISDVCKGTIAGFGYDSYTLAVEYLVNEGKRASSNKDSESIKNQLNLTMPTSKSELQRAILIAACEKVGKSTTILNVNYPLCEDVNSTIEFVVSAGANVDILGDNRIIIYGCDLINSNKEIISNVGESGTLLRMLIGMLSFSKNKVKLIPTGTLINRKMDNASNITKMFYREFYKENNSFIFKNSYLTNDKIEDEYEIDGKESSQYISGLLIGLTYSDLVDKDITIHVKNVVSSEYILITLSLLDKFEKKVSYKDNDMYITLFKSNPYHHYVDSNNYFISVYPDFSSIAAISAAIYGLKIEKPVYIKQVNKIGYLPDLNQCKQPDKIFGHIASAFLSTELHNSNTALSISYINEPWGMNVYINEFPDIFPYLATVAALSKQGKFTISGIDRLVNKESNRCLAIKTEFEKLGIASEVKDNSFIIDKKENNSEIIIPDNYIIKTYNDHRIAMAMAIIVLSITKDFSKIVFDNEDCLKKSYPTFMEDLKKLFDFKNA